VATATGLTPTGWISLPHAVAAGAVPEHLRDRIGHRLAGEGLAGPAPIERRPRQAISHLNHRLRYALDEYDELLPPTPVPE
jgi:hypothetical protein